METTNRIEAQEAAAAPGEPAIESLVSPEMLGVRPVVATPLREVGVCRLPEVCEWVRYHTRGDEARRGRRIVPALVVWRDEETRTLELCLVHEANDVRQQERVREWPGGDERGWEPLPSHGAELVDPTGVGVDMGAVAKHADEEATTLRVELAALREVVLGEYDMPEAPILAMLDDLDKRVDALAKPAAVKVKTPVAKKATAKKGKRGK